MAGTRLQIDLFFKDKTIEQVNKDNPELLLAINEAKTKATKINEGKSNEENTITAKYHICRHDEGKSCDPIVEI